ncbi:MAG: hypothetical protein H0X30_03680 [Anaerolineae bacterium]|nr:hypothetical protein [Anaerolineae bacterium]
MTIDLIDQLTGLLYEWNALAIEVKRRFALDKQPIQSAYYAGVIFGMDMACNNLTKVVESAIAAQITDI